MEKNDKETDEIDQQISMKMYISGNEKKVIQKP